MTFRRVLAISAALVILLAGVTSCGSKRGSVPTTPGSTTMPADRFTALAASFGRWQDVEVPVTVSLATPSKFSASGRARMVSGKAIDISLRVIGLEVARFMVTADSVFALSRLDRIYVAEPISQLRKEFPITVGNLQDILVGRAFSPGGTTLSTSEKKEFDMTMAGDSLWTLSPRRNHLPVNYAFVATAADCRMAALVAASKDSGADVEDFAMEISYSKPVATSEAGILQGLTGFGVTAPQIQVVGSLAWKWGSAKWNRDMDITWKTPSGYKRVAGMDILKLLRQQ